MEHHGQDEGDEQPGRAMTVALTREKLRKLYEKKVPNTSTAEQFNWLVGWRAKMLNALPALLDIAASLSAGEGSGMETTAKIAEDITLQYFGVVGSQKTARAHLTQVAAAVIGPQFARLLALSAKAREEGEEAVLRFIEDGSFLHDDAPPKRFAKEVVAAYRARSKP